MIYTVVSPGQLINKHMKPVSKHQIIKTKWNHTSNTSTHMNSNCSSKLVGTCDALLVQATGMPSMARVQKYNGKGLASRQSLTWTVSDHSSCTESNIVICFFSNDEWAIKLRMAECHSYQHHEYNKISNKRNKHIFLNTKSLYTCMEVVFYWINSLTLMVSSESDCR